MLVGRGKSRERPTVAPAGESSFRIFDYTRLIIMYYTFATITTSHPTPHPWRDAGTDMICSAEECQSVPVTLDESALPGGFPSVLGRLSKTIRKERREALILAQCRTRRIIARRDINNPNTF
jgi:hypothetical protein